MTAAAIPQATLDARALRSLRVHKDTWQRNAAANQPRVKAQVGALWMDANPKTGVLVAAGPSLEQSLPELRALDRATHEVVCVDMALGFLLAHGIRPDYVVCLDASADIARTLDVGEAAAGIPLLLSVTVDPKTGAGWKGPIYWYALMSNVYDKDLGEFMQDAHSRVSGVTSFLVPGGNVGSLGLSFLLGIRASPKVLLYGHDFCWTEDARFYCGGVASDLAQERVRSEKEAGTLVAMTEPSGRKVWTNGSLLYFAQWFAEQMERFPGVIENRTPTSILVPGGIPKC